MYRYHRNLTFELIVTVGKIFARITHWSSGRPILRYVFYRNHELYSKPTKNVLNSKITLKKGSNWLYILVNHDVYTGTTKKQRGTKFLFYFCTISAPHHEIYEKCLSLLTNFWRTFLTVLVLANVFSDI